MKKVNGFSKSIKEIFSGLVVRCFLRKSTVLKDKYITNKMKKV